MVREAMECDKTRYLLMVRDFHAAGKFPFGLDMVRQSAIFDEAIRRDKIRLFVAEDTGRLTGFMLVGHSVAVLSGEYVLQEHMLWVDPEFRGGSLVFCDLMGAFVKFGMELGVDRMSVSAQSSMRPEATGRLFRRYGFKETERHYTRRN